MISEPSSEVKAIIREFVRVQTEKHGPDWKAILAKEMAAKTTPFINAILAIQKAAK